MTQPRVDTEVDQHAGGPVDDGDEGDGGDYDRLLDGYDRQQERTDTPPKDR